MITLGHEFLFDCAIRVPRCKQNIFLSRIHTFQNQIREETALLNFVTKGQNSVSVAHVETQFNKRWDIKRR